MFISQILFICVKDGLPDFSWKIHLVAFEWAASFCSFSIIMIIYSIEFFISALADGLSLGFEWQQVSSSLQETFQYSGRSQ